MSYVIERRLEEKEQRRADIVDAAEACYCEGDWEKVTMDQIARRARISRALLYVYFKDKDDLHFAIAERALNVLRERFVAAMSQHERGLEQVEAIGHAYVIFAAELPHYFNACSRFEAHQPDEVDAQSNECACMIAGDAVHGLVADAINRGMKDGSISPSVGDPMLTAIVLWGFIHGIIQLGKTKAHVMARDGLSIESLVDQGIRMAGRALAHGPV
jgi:AcrR family transcriptional regulator